MAHKIEGLRGMDDILPGEVEKWQSLEQQARIFFGSEGFREIRTPILEYTELFARSAGESSDIVSKEMFSFKDRGDRDITMRPEMTASVARSVIEKGLLSQAKSLLLYYIAPMFRAERPQAGRKRQFHQIGAELINIDPVIADFLCIKMLHGFFEFIGLREVVFKVNDLGNADDQKKLRDSLRIFFSEKIENLCKDCHYRIEKNVLRVLDCKNPACQPIIDAAPSHEPSASFKMLLKQMEEAKISCQINRRLVRGLDYYNGFVFEVTASGLGAQDALAGGGRYDRLYEQLGGKATPCTGFSIGFERLLLAMGAGTKPYNQNIIYLAPCIKPDKNIGYKIIEKAGDIYEELRKLRQELILLGMTVFLDRHLDPIDIRDHLKAANRKAAGFVVIMGPDEYQKGNWTVKNMNTGEQHSVEKGKLFLHLKGNPSV